jgi:putative alpha-1,2-mannosidase
MKKQSTLLLLLSLIVACSSQDETRVSQYVDPFIGTAYTGHTFPGATYPLGLMQPGPQTGNCAWEYCAGYNYEDSLMEGFTQTRLSGTGIPDLGDILMMPFSGTPRDDYKSAFSKKNDKENPSLYINFQSGNVSKTEQYETRVLESEITNEDNRTISGTTKELQLAIAFSTVSVGNAKQNLETEIKHRSFDEVKRETENTWENYLSRIQIKGTAEQKTSAYTSLYHLLIQPNNLADVNGQYRAVVVDAWQYTWHVMQDVDGLVNRIGGKEAFATKLDSLFFLQPAAENTGFVSDVTGLIGQYAQGNEPSHHVIYLYSLVDKPRRTAELIRTVFDTFYQPRTDGLCGNDDCGQMSAWYLFSALGFYPVNPVSGEYVLGAPQFPEMTIQLPGNKSFSVIARHLSKENKYVKSIQWNGEEITTQTITHKQIMQGGTLVFEMTK